MTTIIIFLPRAPTQLVPSSSEKTLAARSFKTSAHRKMKVLPFVILCFTTIVVADNFKLVSGKEYKNVTVSRVEPDGIVLIAK